MHVNAFGPPPARMTRELDAVVESAERATQQILGAAEDIEDAANTLSASLKREQEKSLALDIQDNVLRIFEACNFQDLTGQRIAKVLTTLKFVEERIAHMIEIWGGIDAFKTYAVAAAAELDRRRTVARPEARRRRRSRVAGRRRRHVRHRLNSAFALSRLRRPQAPPDKRTTPAPGSRPAQAPPDRTRARDEGEHQRRDRLHHQPRAGDPPDRRAVADRTEQHERNGPACNGDQAVRHAEHHHEHAATSADTPSHAISAKAASRSPTASRATMSG